ncbi:hypothetical protein LOC68_07200 [Blastopirellula sp. JC732]|uniref:DUF7939 domain-containing protein n=1 Tax=Blastopirellula sediminis TaxID=2894196 RepID=A0A9X1MLN1_9BACT|nr:hypothetical protein [Blastopirellula sediminis]MCC9609046.1 hypothetical protein [Blastopirellula sediminis]MCC9628177.1 hypothetical protein [Blastopirellula sediminis]
MNVVRIAALLLICVSPLALLADDVPAITSRFATEKPWVGQRIGYYVEVRAKGSFSGATSFSLPEVPQTVIVKMGSPTVSSEQKGEDTWFVQIHEFAVFTQAAGELTIPSYSVRYGHHDGFTGPVHDESGEVPAASVDVESPPGREPAQFLITTDKLMVKETWEPAPGKVKQGDIVSRKIMQSATEMTGMALAPPSLAAPDGVHVYPGQPDVADKTDRGELSGERTDVIKYRFDQPGVMTIPAATYVWWNPKEKKFGRQELPAVTFDVEASPQLAEVTGNSTSRRVWLYPLLIAIAVAAVAVWRREQLVRWFQRKWKRWHPPDRVAAKRLCAACRGNDSHAAEAAWSAWLNTQPDGWKPGDELQRAVQGLHQCRYAEPAASDWKGSELLTAFQAERRAQKRDAVGAASPLPTLNPGR